jgi:hypothetical protein
MYLTTEEEQALLLKISQALSEGRRIKAREILDLALDVKNQHRQRLSSDMPSIITSSLQEIIGP